MSEPDGIDELVDSLFVPSRNRPEPVQSDSDWTPPQRVWVIPRWVAFTVPVGMLVLGVALASSPDDESSRVRGPAPAITKTVTETVTEAALPPACKRTLAAIERMMAANGAIADAGEEQLDILHAARQAIFTKDWKMLDKVMVRQTELNDKLDTPNLDALGSYADLRDAMKDCHAATG